MPRLVVNPDTPECWQIELQPGTISLGRAETNDYPLEHPSVSSSHCEIAVTDAGVRIKDLGSTSGTFLEGELVEEARLKPGQVIRLGGITMRFEGEASAAGSAVVAEGPPVPPRLPSPSGPTPNQVCKFHPKWPGRYACPRCRLSYCELCADTRFVGGRPRKFCRACGSECEAIHTPALTPAAPPPGFLAALPRAFLFPFQGSGVILLVAGTAFFFLLNRLPLLGFLLTGYLFNYAKSIVTSSAGGRAELPDWPDFTDWKDDILVPYLQMVALLVLAFGPALVLSIWHPGTDSQNRLMALAAMGSGALFAPMGMLALAMFDTVAALNPVALTLSILRIPGPYLVAAATFELVLVFHRFAQQALLAWVPVPLAPQVISSFLYLYLMAVGMRLLGLLYLTQSDKLGWFRPNR